MNCDQPCSKKLCNVMFATFLTLLVMFDHYALHTNFLYVILLFFLIKIFYNTLFNRKRVPADDLV
jgi:hypothetical protein